MNPQPEPAAGAQASAPQPPHWGHPAPPEDRPNGRVPSASTAGPAAPPVMQSAPAKPRGWWRRNWIGLLALLPMLVVALVVRWDSIYWYAWKSQPRVPVNTAPQQWVGFSGAQMRLAEFGAATGVQGSNNKPLALPAGVTVWKAVLEFKAPNQDAVQGCAIYLEDSGNRLFGTGASELSNVRGQSFITCTKPSEQASTDYATTVLFITPAGVKPVAIQIRWKLQFPSYVRLSVGA